jgi:hypothetical protein
MLQIVELMPNGTVELHITMLASIRFDTFVNTSNVVSKGFPIQ